MWDVSVLSQSTRLRILQSIFLFIGIGALVPWNIFISAKFYYTSRFCNHHHEEEEPAQHMTSHVSSSSIFTNFESTFTTVYNVSSVITMLLIIGIQMCRDNTNNSNNNSNDDEVRHSIIPSTSDTPDHHGNHNHTIHRHQDMDGTVEMAPSSIVISEQESLSYSPTTNENQLDTTNETTNSHSFWLVMVPLLLFIITFIVQFLLVFLVHVPYFGTITLLCLSVCGIASGISGAGFVATAGTFHASIGMNPYQIGMSIAGIIVSLINFIIAFLNDPTDYNATYCNTAYNNNAYLFLYDDDATVLDNNQYITWHDVNMINDDREMKGHERIAPTCHPYTSVDYAIAWYFLLGTIVLVLCLIGFTCMPYLRYDITTNTTNSGCSTSTDHDIHQTTSIRRSNQYETIQTNDDENAYDNNGSISNSTKLVVEPDVLNIESLHDLYLITNLPIVDTNVSLSFQNVWEQVHGPAICIFVTFFITLGLFPGWTSELRSIYQCHPNSYRISNDLYIPLTFVVFNLGDLSGRLLSTTPWATDYILQSPSVSRKLIILSCLRILFFPLLLLCSCSESITPPLGFYIPSDVYSILVQFLFAVSSGFLISSSFAVAPTLVIHNATMQERMSEILSFAVSTGLFSGSILSIILSNFITRTN